MKKKNQIQTLSPIFVSVLLAFPLLFSLALPQEVGDEREFDYLGSSGKGPAHWGDLKEEWSACKKGAMQSPIDLSCQRMRMIRKSGELQKNYIAAPATLKNRGHDISLKWEKYGAGSVKINGSKYFLEQAHWHSPSEHTINGRRYALELHMVHACPDGKIAVIGLLYKFGAPDAFLSKLISKITLMGDNHDEQKMGVIHPNDIKIRGRKYYRYKGSLTVPPCTEGVIWTVNKKIGTVSREQVRALRTAVHDYAEANARPVQPLNHREVQLYGLDAGHRIRV